MMPRSFLSRLPLCVWLMLVTGFAALALVAALVAQYGFGLPPCVLCLWQRVPYGLVALAGAAYLRFAPQRITINQVFAVLAAVFALSAALALYHSGVERHWWGNAFGCSATAGGMATTIEALRAQIAAAPTVPCDQIAWTLWGLSMANYNIIVSLAASALCVLLARQKKG